MAIIPVAELEDEIETTWGSYVVLGHIVFDDEESIIKGNLIIKKGRTAEIAADIHYQLRPGPTVRWESELADAGRFAVCVMGKTAPAIAPRIMECWNKTFGQNPDASTADNLKAFADCLSASKALILIDLAAAIAECASGGN